MIDDEVIRTWNKRARLDGKVFPCLRFLFLRFQLGVTEMSLQELGGFKRLECVVTSRCGVSIREGKNIARRWGWGLTR
jgi:hypothetical protein